jgi:glycine dehydrogenase
VHDEAERHERDDAGHVARVRAIHPFAPREQWRGYRELIDEPRAMAREATGYDAVSLQPNAGSQGEYAGLLIIKA